MLTPPNSLSSQPPSNSFHTFRDYSKAVTKAKQMGFPAGSYTVMHLDLASLDSVRDFVNNFRASGRRLDALVCNAAVYLPTAKEPT